MTNDMVCCPFCLSLDPNRVGIERATGIRCRHEFHCPVPDTHGDPFRYCAYCNWNEDGVRPYQPDDRHTIDIGTPERCYRCGGSGPGVLPAQGEGGFVWACPTCPHPADERQS